ncbi:hypothetical protein M117_3222 [Bacteroides fragilis str. 3774 T13]|nr:hypothetical protein M117_3222 [Bacteroides fragilis str. 3774 T13]
MIHNLLGKEQPANYFHDIDKSGSVSEIERGKGLFVGALLQLFRVLDTPFD